MYNFADMFFCHFTKIGFFFDILVFKFLILSKKVRQKKKLPPDEGFKGSPNDLNKIIEGVSLKEKEEVKETEENVDVSENNEKNEQNSEEKEQKSEKKTRKPPTKRLNAKDAIISKEILKKKF